MKSKQLKLSRLANIISVISGVITVFQVFGAIFWKLPNTLNSKFPQSNAFIVYVIISGLILWLFCFSTMFIVSNRFHSMYFNKKFVFNRYRKFRALSLITSIFTGIIFLGLEAIIVILLLPSAISVALISSAVFWVLTATIWYRGFVWYDWDGNS